MLNNGRGGDELTDRIAEFLTIRVTNHEIPLLSGVPSSTANKRMVNYNLGRLGEAAVGQPVLSGSWAVARCCGLGVINGIVGVQVVGH